MITTIGQTVYLVPEYNSVYDYPSDFLLIGKILRKQVTVLHEVNQTPTTSIKYFIEIDDSLDMVWRDDSEVYFDKHQALQKAKEHCEKVFNKLEKKIQNVKTVKLLIDDLLTPVERD